MAVFLNNVISLWASNGIFDIALPLILFFAIIFSILNRSKILGHNKSIDAVVAFVVSMFIILNPLTAPFLAEVFSKTGIALIVFVAILIILGLFVEKRGNEDMFKKIGGVAVVLFVIWLIVILNDFYSIYLWFPVGFYGITSEWIFVALFVVITLGLIVWNTGKEDQVSSGTTHRSGTSS